MSIAEKLTAIAENEQRVYDTGYMHGSNAGYVQGEQNGYDFGFDEGKKAEYDRFWDAFQDNGNRIVYQHAFAGYGWTPQNLKPKYKIAPIDTTATSQYGTNMFYRGYQQGSYGTRFDFSQIQDMFDFSKLQRATGMFDSCGFTNVYCDFSNVVDASYVFASQWGGGVDKVAVKVTEKMTTWTNAFLYNRFLTDFELVEGSVLVADTNLSSCPLTKASITSVINALSTSTTGKTVTINKAAKEAAFTADEWAELIATKTNWTISLV